MELGSELGDAVVSSSCVGVSCLPCILVLVSSWGSSTGSNPGKSGKSLLTVSCCGQSSEYLVPPSRHGQQMALSCSTTSPAPPTPPVQAQQDFSSPSARLGRGFLNGITSSHELVASRRVVPMLCQLLPKSLPDPAHPCFEACLHQLGFQLLSHPIPEHHFGGPHPDQPLNWC